MANPVTTADIVNNEKAVMLPPNTASANALAKLVEEAPLTPMYPFGTITNDAKAVLLKAEKWILPTSL